VEKQGFGLVFEKMAEYPSESTVSRCFVEDGRILSFSASWKDNMSRCCLKRWQKIFLSLQKLNVALFWGGWQNILLSMAEVNECRVVV
jgi:hypothetical protein